VMHILSIWRRDRPSDSLAIDTGRKVRDKALERLGQKAERLPEGFDVGRFSLGGCARASMVLPLANQRLGQELRQRRWY